MARRSAADLYGQAVVRERVAWAMLLASGEDDASLQPLVERWRRAARALGRSAAMLARASGRPGVVALREDGKPRVAGRLTLKSRFEPDAASR